MSVASTTAPSTLAEKPLRYRTCRGESEALELVPENYFARMIPGQVFSRTAPLEVDAGCGDGGFLLERAAQYPERNFLGIERLLGRVRRTVRGAARRGLENVRVLRLETAYTIEWLMPPGSVQILHIMFPDPWPKRRHKVRRLVNAEFLRSAARALAPGGEVRISTDHIEYFEQMMELASADSAFCVNDWNPGPDYPQTDFERHFRKAGFEIRRARFRKV